MFICYFCNTNINSEDAIYYALDHNYCSRECRLNSVGKHKVSSIQVKNNDIIDNVENTIMNLPYMNSYKSCQNLELLSIHELNNNNCLDDNIESYNKIVCENYLTNTLSRIIYTVSSLWNIYYID